MSLADLIARVQSGWRRVGYRDDAFPRVAAQCLTESEPHAWLGLGDILDHTFDPDATDHRRFKRCPDVLTLYTGPRFGIYAHLWLDSAVEPHHHVWNGAYQVLAGSSIHARYSFVLDEALQHRLRYGQLTTVAVEQLRSGDTVPVRAGPDWIHALAYNERPSLALSIRAAEPVESVRMEYWRAGIAVEAESPRDAELLRRKALSFLVRFDPQEARRRLVEWMDTCDALAAFHLLRFATRLPVAPDMWAALVEAGGSNLGEPFPRLLAAIGEFQRLQQLQALRARVHDPDRRALLSTLYFGAERSAILDLLAVRNGGHATGVDLRGLFERLIADGVVGGSFFGQTPDDSLCELLCTFVQADDAGSALRLAAEEFELDTDRSSSSELVREAYERFRRHTWVGGLLA